MKRGIASGTIHDLQRLIHARSKEEQLIAVKKEMFELHMDIEKALQDWHPKRADERYVKLIISH
ncbi:hypothetical protein [Peptoclostridium acidaminophilum]|uniref:hypothetical protein n=1 Tax=Peptoclostridium acidaminophilum TaxID=1731 RepID=UPI00046D6498|nr:hypothetical protein [Peptoclostridium acidaminophilum]